ncbi:hypothetical protein KKD52_14875 [Myxococcota bacterium]|nr:hypothetical protein [Myxococcota bacterium]MBU1412542.1 hypothetical protein [Myxococcota bacterium]MBU1511635.1 hypothetical protein [Myxococcota bacterium]
MQPFNRRPFSVMQVTVLLFLLILGSGCGQTAPGAPGPSRAEPGMTPPPPPPRPVPPAPNPPEPAPPVDDGFRLTFSLIDGETSKDSHQIRWSCRIEGLQVVYSGPYGECERGQCQHKEIRFVLTAAQRAEVISLLQSEARFVDLEEVLADRGIGKWVQASLEVKHETKVLRIRIGGMTHAWGKTDKKNMLGADARGRLAAMDALRRRLAAFAAGHFKDYHSN